MWLLDLFSVAAVTTSMRGPLARAGSRIRESKADIESLGSCVAVSKIRLA